MLKPRYHPPCGKHRWDLFLFINTPTKLRTKSNLDPIPETRCLHCLQQLNGESEHKCNPDNPYEICSIRGVNKVSTGVGDFVINSNDTLTEAEREARREKCRKQWQISPEALKSISNSYPKVNHNLSASSAPKEGRSGGHSRRSENKDNINRKGDNSFNGNKNPSYHRRLPPIDRSTENQNIIGQPEPVNENTNDYIDRSNKTGSSSVGYTREGTESSCSQIMDSHRETSLTHIDASVREDHSISCEPEWIVPRPTKVKPTDNLKWEGPMELETTFRSTIDSTAAQRLIASRQEGENASPISVNYGNDGDPSVPFKRRHRPKTSLKPGGEGYYSTINRESYKNFVIVDQSREQMVQERLDALARSMDERSVKGKTNQVSGNGYQMNKSTETLHRSQGAPKASGRSRSKRSTDLQPTTPSRSAAAINDSNQQHKVVKSKASGENKSHRTESKEHQSTVNIAKSKSSHHIGESVEHKSKQQNDHEINHTIKRSTKSSEDIKSQQQHQQGHQQSTSKMDEHKEDTPANLTEKSKHEVNNSEAKGKSSEKIDVKEKVDRRGGDQNSETHSNRNESGRVSHNKSPIPIRSGGTVPFAEPIVRPSPIRPISSLTLYCKFKGDQGETLTDTAIDHSDEIKSSVDRAEVIEKRKIVENSVSDKRQNHETSHRKESVKVDRERERLKASKSSSHLHRIDDDENVDDDKGKSKNGQNGLDDDNPKVKNDHRRGRSLPRNRASRNRNESHLRFDGDMEFETTTKHFFHDGIELTEYIRECCSSQSRKPHRDLFRTSSEAELLANVKSSSKAKSTNMNKDNSKSSTVMTTSTTYNSVYRNKLYCPAIDLTPKNPEYKYKGEAGGHHFFQPVTQY